MPRQTTKVGEDFEDFVRRSYGGASPGSSGRRESSTGGSACSSRSPAPSSEPSPPSSPESIYPDDAEILLGLSPANSRRLLSPFNSPCHMRRRVSPEVAVGQLSEAALERHTRMFESRERTGRSPHPSYRFDLSEERKSMTPSPSRRRRRTHPPLGLSLSANAGVFNSPPAARRPVHLQLTVASPTQVAPPGGTPLGGTTQMLYRVRSFSTSSKGLINRGDCLRVRTTSNNLSSEKKTSTSSSGSDLPEVAPSRTSKMDLKSGGTFHCVCAKLSAPPVYKVLVLGASNVGKTSLTQQFMTSEYMGQEDTCLSDQERSVHVMLDGQEATLQFTDVSADEDYLWYDDVDAYLIVYSVSDLRSCQRAAQLLADIRHDLSRHTAIILVANKADIVRNRLVSDTDGRRLANKYHSKYIAVSAVLNHRVDELLAGVLHQVRLARHAPCRAGNEHSWVAKAAMGLSRVMRKHPFYFRSCDNLLVL